MCMAPLISKSNITYYLLFKRITSVRLSVVSDQTIQREMLDIECGALRLPIILSHCVKDFRLAYAT
jgi:hypothetical protein